MNTADTQELPRATVLRAIAIDDEPPALRVLTHFCNQTPDVTLLKTFTRTDEAHDFLHQNPVDLLFLDINMPAQSGIAFFQALPQPPLVIFTTAYAEYAVEGFNLSAVDYLLKPFTMDRFRQSIDKALAQQKLRQGTSLTPAESAQTYLLVRADYTLQRIPLNEITLIEGLDDYLKIHRTTGHPVVARLTMKAILEKLPESSFVRVHRSFIIPLNRVEGVRSKTIRVAGRAIPLGASYEADFLRRIEM
jgi:two-component system, LytTR family, response regulator LytT